MKRLRLIYALTLSLLVYGVASAIEATDALMVHDMNSVTHTDSSQATAQHADDGEDHCTHCCHTHVSNLSTSSANTGPVLSTHRFSSARLHIENPILGPPTPPPNT